MEEVGDRTNIGFRFQLVGFYLFQLPDDCDPVVQLGFQFAVDRDPVQAAEQDPGGPVSALHDLQDRAGDADLEDRIVIFFFGRIAEDACKNANGLIWFQGIIDQLMLIFFAQHDLENDMRKGHDPFHRKNSHRGGHNVHVIHIVFH